MCLATLWNWSLFLFVYVLNCLQSTRLKKHGMKCWPTSRNSHQVYYNRLVLLPGPFTTIWIYLFIYFYLFIYLFIYFLIVCCPLGQGSLESDAVRRWETLQEGETWKEFVGRARLPVTLPACRTADVQRNTTSSWHSRGDCIMELHEIFDHEITWHENLYLYFIFIFVFIFIL